MGDGAFMQIINAYSLTPKRTEYGKAIRKQYESHNVYEYRRNMTKPGIRGGGICGTLTSVQKDNYILEVWTNDFSDKQ